MKMFVSFVLFAAFALPAAFAAEQDVITLRAYQELLKNGAADGITKTVISNPVLEEALVSYSRKRFGSSVLACEETCQTVNICHIPGCLCDWPLCTKNSLENRKSANPVLEEALVTFAKKGNLGGIAM